MGYLIGAAIAIFVAIGARAVGLDRDRAFYPTVLIVVASYYVLFAVMAQSTEALLAELVGLAAFTALAVVGFKWSPWLVAAGLAGHGVFDVFHGFVIANPGVPSFWPPFCIGYDVVAGVVVAILMRKPAVAAAA